jgi:hypothetical protein
MRPWGTCNLSGTLMWKVEQDHLAKGRFRKDLLLNPIWLPVITRLPAHPLRHSYDQPDTCTDAVER